MYTWRNSRNWGLGVAAFLAMAAVAFAQDSTPAAAGTAPDQGAQKQELFQSMRADIQSLRADAHAQIRALLTSDQQAQFDALPALNEPPMHRGMGKGRGDWGGRRAGRMQDGPPADMSQRILDRLTQKLNLTEEQQTGIETLLQNAQAARQTRGQEARADFRALLTPEQATLLDQQKAKWGSARSGWHRGRGPGAMPANKNALQLTDDQKVQAKTIFENLRTDLGQLRADTQQQIRAELTADQQATYDVMRARQASAAGPQGGKGAGKGIGRGVGKGMGEGMGMHHPGGPGGFAGHQPDGTMLLNRLTTKLNLTEDQQAQVKTILSDLHTAIKARMQEARAAVQALSNSD